MLTLRRLLGFALAASAAWLLGVLQAQIGTPAAGAIGVLVLLVWTLLAWRHRAGRRFLLLPVGGLIAAAILVPMLMPASPRPLRPEADPHWQPFDERRVAQEVDAGRTVFVHITAGWCVTCQVNKRLVLDRGEVARRLFGDPSIVALQADWTRPDPRIAAYLAGFGRYGIPFDAVFGPAAPQGIVLGEVLTGRAVLDALSAASARLTYHRPS
jgi:suppressor for copper-sensitivity B